MITYTQILKRINTILKENFNILIDDLSIDEKFTRPSFRVEIDDIKHEVFMTSHKKTSFIIRIYYFMPNKTTIKKDKLEVIYKLQDLFSLFLILEEYKDGSKFLLPIDELSFVENDGVLITSFETYMYEDLVKDIDLEYIEELEITNKGGKK